MNHSEIASFIWGVADLIRDTFKRGKYQSECHVCAKGGSELLTGPCSVGKEAARGVQNRGQG